MQQDVGLLTGCWLCLSPGLESPKPSEESERGAPKTRPSFARDGMMPKKAGSSKYLIYI